MSKKTIIAIVIVSVFSLANAQVNFQWAKGMGASGVGDQAYSIVVDASGNIYTTGTFEGTVDFDPGPGTFTLSATSQEGIFISKLDVSGNFVWAKCLGGANSFGDFSAAIALDASGNIYATGGFNGVEDFDPGAGTYTLSSMTNNGDAFISKLDPAGNYIWAKSFSSDGGSEALGIAIDGAGNVCLSGLFYGTNDFDPSVSSYTLSSGNPLKEDIFISKYDSNGSFIWAKNISGSTITGDEAKAIFVDPSNNIYTTGFFTGTADFDPGAGVYNLTATNFGDVFISKLDAFGNFIWARQFAVNNNGIGNSIVVDNSGNVYTTGTFNGTGDFDPGIGTFTITSSGNYNGFISKLDATGNFVWAKNIAGLSSGNDLSVDASNSIYITGGFSNACDFDPGVGVYNLTSMGQTDIFNCKLDASGNFLWAQQMGGTMNDVGNSIAVDVAGYVYTTGGFQGTCDFDPGAGAYNLTSQGSYDIFVLKLNGAVGINENAFTNNSIKLYPNPTSKSLFVSALKNEFENSEIEITNTLGEIVLKLPYENEIDVSKLAQGFYNLKMKSADGHIFVSKFIKE